MTRWRSSAMAYAALGAGLAGCSPGDTVNETRNVYPSQDACQRDYPAQRCTSSGRIAFGPWYSADRSTAPAGDPGPGASAVNGRSQWASNTEGRTVRRGGFGHSSRGRSARS